jgi:osmotically-inducible protein OsmY
MRTTLDDGRIEFRPATPGAPRHIGRRGDASIRAEILDRIARAPWLDLEGVAVRVERGEVTFDGEIGEQRLQVALREIASRCSGVRAVHDHLRVAEGSRTL